MGLEEPEAFAELERLSARGSFTGRSVLFRNAGVEPVKIVSLAWYDTLLNEGPSIVQWLHGKNTYRLRPLFHGQTGSRFPAGCTR